MNLNNSKVFYHQPIEKENAEEEYRPSKKVMSGTKKLQESPLRTRQNRAEPSTGLSPSKQELNSSASKTPLPFSKQAIFSSRPNKLPTFKLPHQFPQPFAPNFRQQFFPTQMQHHGKQSQQ